MAVYVETIVVGPYQENCYLVIPGTPGGKVAATGAEAEAAPGAEAGAASGAAVTKREAAIVDPGAEASRILRAVEAAGVKVQYILLTHAHPDHVGALEAVQAATGAKVVLHRDDAPMLAQMPRRAPEFWEGDPAAKPEADIVVDGGEELDLGGIRINVLRTPGHTRGGVCYLVGDEICFTGDTLFASGIGRTDLEGGSFDQLIDSIRSRLLTLDGETVIYPGHGPAGTIGEERDFNPWLKGEH